jgi:hypothetical protein
VLLGQGKKVAEIVQALGITDVTDSRWRQEFGGMSTAHRTAHVSRESLATSSGFQPILTERQGSEGRWLLTGKTEAIPRK